MNNKIIIGVLAVFNIVAIYANPGLLGDIVQGAANVAGTAVEGAANVAEDIVEAPAAIVSGDRYYIGPRGERIYYEPRVYRRPVGVYSQPVGYGPVEEEVVYE